MHQMGYPRHGYYRGGGFFWLVLLGLIVLTGGKFLGLLFGLFLLAIPFMMFMKMGHMHRHGYGRGWHRGMPGHRGEWGGWKSKHGDWGDWKAKRDDWRYWDEEKSKRGDDDGDEKPKRDDQDGDEKPKRDDNIQYV